MTLLLLACAGGPAKDTPADTGDSRDDSADSAPADTGDSGTPPAPRVTSLADADAAIYGGESYAVGNAVAFGGDDDGDGYDEAVVAASFIGWTCVVRGPPTPGAHPIEDADACYTPEGERDYAGQSLAAGRDMTGDGVPDMLVGALANDELGPDAGKIYLVPGPWTGGALADAPTSFLGESKGDLAGSAVALLGDIDGDGDGDLVIGAMANEGGGSGAGKAYVFRGPLEAREYQCGEADVSIAGEGPGGFMHGAPLDGDGVGSVLAAPGDVNGDGLDDLLIGANGNEIGGNDAGAAALFLGPLTDGAQRFTDADGLWVGQEALEYVGDTVAGAGDVDGDGLVDVLIGGATGAAGSTWVWPGPGPAGTTTIAGASLRFDGEAIGDLAGAAVSTAGDTDGDGWTDLVLGAQANDDAGTDAGAAYLVRGPFPVGVVSLADADHAWLGEHPADAAGRAVAGGGDLDGDGHPDVLIGAEYAATGGDYGGEVYLLLSP